MKEETIAEMMDRLNCERVDDGVNTEDIYQLTGIDKEPVVHESAIIMGKDRVEKVDAEVNTDFVNMVEMVS
jgi:hypothetical protein